MNLIEKKIKELGDFIGVVSFKPGTDNHHRLKNILLEIYKAGKEGVSLDNRTVGDFINDEDYPLNHD